MAGCTVEKSPPDFEDFTAIHALLTDAFRFMEGRINPPSSLKELSAQGLRQKAQTEDFFLIRHDAVPLACVFGVPMGEVYYIGKLAVAAPHRGRGFAGALIDAAAQQARSVGCAALELQTRIELTENHAAFARMGFVQTDASAHPGYSRPTSLTFRRAV